MTLVLVNYANGRFRESQRTNAASGRAVGGVDHVLTLGPSDLDLRFRLRNRRILNDPHGAGFWLWKPYVVLRALEALDAGDWLFYSDSGAFFVDSARHLVDFADAGGLDVLLFDAGPFLERRYTKRDTFLLLDCDSPEFGDTRQRGARFILWRRSPAALELAREWLDVARDERAVTDRGNRLGLPNAPDWIAHRHDQSILSLLSKKAGIPSFRDPSQDGEKWRAEYPESTFPQVMRVARTRRLPVGTRLRGTIGRRAGDLRDGRVGAALHRAVPAASQDERG